MKIRLSGKSDLDRLSHHMSDFVERALHEKSALMNVYDGTWRPSIDVFETEESILVIVDLAGVSRDEITIEQDGEVLRIAGRRRDPEDLHTADLKRCHQMEIDYGPFERLVRISGPIDREKTEARCENGFLKILLSKEKKELAQRIEII